MEASLGKIPTTSVLRLTSALARSGVRSPYPTSHSPSTSMTTGRWATYCNIWRKKSPLAPLLDKFA